MPKNTTDRIKANRYPYSFYGNEVPKFSQMILYGSTDSSNYKNPIPISFLFKKNFFMQNKFSAITLIKLEIS